MGPTTQTLAAFTGSSRGLAGGFRYHHEDPTAILRISWFEYASHTHLLCAVVLLLGSKIRTAFRVREDQHPQR